MIHVIRHWYTDKSITGMLDLDGVFECYSLEPPTGTVKPYCIPSGQYIVKKYESPKLGRLVLAVLNVPGFEDIEIHNGNYPINTHGCTLVGTTRGLDFVGNSVLALDALLAKLPNDVEIDIEYLDAQEVSA